MVRSRVQTFRYKAGKRTVIVINIVQTARAAAKLGNVLASNAVNIQITKKQKKR
ncbi:hypothetical protein [Paenibacillus hexagrammi]|uniref:Uncharacterized protein n=1 Tax=Paenibacillus hexagrammi TaxID=2908839 RepID=A0ABY3SBH1_9BACL|nr:hypothetical protein [Paenibacillus sp. YPD9-1]UJF31323.1 hypothetical protein L0M14_15795 [Paenibacillus sp. YPD9-1]